MIDGWIFRNLKVMREKKLQKLRRVFFNENVAEEIKTGYIYAFVASLKKIYKMIKRLFKGSRRG